MLSRAVEEKQKSAEASRERARMEYDRRVKSNKRQCVFQPFGGKPLRRVETAPGVGGVYPP